MRAVRTMRPSLVILDLELPLLDGHAVGSRLRASYGVDLVITLGLLLPFADQESTSAGRPTRKGIRTASGAETSLLMVAQQTP